MTDQGGEDEYLDPSLRLEHYCFENQFEKSVLIQCVKMDIAVFIML